MKINIFDTNKLQFMSKFGELIDAQVPVLIDFFTEWNEPSVAMNEVIRQRSSSFRR